MFERYTESARRTLFSARHEASVFGSPSIDAMHLLVGIIREARDITARILEMADCPLEDLRADILSHIPAHTSANAAGDVPFTENVKRILNASAFEADRVDSTAIGSEHLLLGILSKDDSAAIKILSAHGLRLDDVRQRVAAEPKPVRYTTVMAGRANVDELAALISALHAMAPPSEAADRLVQDIRASLNALKLHIFTLDKQ